MRTDREIVESYIPMAQYLGMLLGPNAEVTVHDLSDMAHSIIFIVNGRITGRKLGDGFRSFSLSQGLDHIYKGLSFTGRAPYSWGSDTDRRNLYSSTFHIRNDSGDLIGFVGVVEDMTMHTSLLNWLNDQLDPQTPPAYDEADSCLNGGSSAANVVDVMITNCLNRLNQSSAKGLRKEDKMSIIESFEKQNLFAIRGVVKLVAQRLKISEPSVYRYLREIRGGG